MLRPQNFSQILPTRTQALHLERTRRVRAGAAHGFDVIP